jgi:hypothetical protein
MPFGRRIGKNKVQYIIFGVVRISICFFNRKSVARGTGRTPDLTCFAEVSSCLNLTSERCSLESHPKLKII